MNRLPGKATSDLYSENRKEDYVYVLKVAGFFDGGVCLLACLPSLEEARANVRQRGRRALSQPHPLSGRKATPPKPCVGINQHGAKSLFVDD